MKRENQQDATVRCLLLTLISTCFGHHYAHLQEYKNRVNCIWCAVLVLLDVVGSGCGELRCRMRAVLTSKRCILYIYSTNIGTEYFKYGIYS